MDKAKLAALATGLIVVGAAALPAAGAGAEVTKGQFGPVPGHGDFGITGKAKMVRTAAGTTIVKVKVKGLEPGQTYPAHVHNGSCESGGGGHYQNEVGGLAAPPNELWPTSNNDEAGIASNPAGNGSGKDKADWTARPEAQSVVLHKYDNPAIRVACAQLM